MALHKSKKALCIGIDPGTPMDLSGCVNDANDWASPRRSPSIFISYRRSDAAQVDALAAALRAEGLNVWLDRDEIEDAASIQGRIDQGLAESHALLAWYGLDYPKSRACQWELTAALIAAGAETAPVKRLLVANPETTAEHIQPLAVRDLQHFAFNNDYADLARRIKASVTGINGTLGSLRRLAKPQWHGAHGLGSNRFVGRVGDLWRIHSNLAAGNFAIVAGSPSPRSAGELAQVRGSGGIGKSLLAEEYALRFGAWWPGGVYWLRAYGNSDNPDESTEALAARRVAAYGSQLAGFAQELGLETQGKGDAEIRADLGRHLARRNQPYLWIVDDLPACGRDELERWLAPGRDGQTLVTTRSQRLQGLGGEIDLALLPPEDARALLTAGHPPRADEAAAVERILELLDGLALALDVARAACRRQGYAGFLQRLENPDKDALALAAEIAGDLPNGHNPHIAATLLASVGQLDERGRDVLRLAARLAAAPIPRELLADCLAAADGLERTEAEDRADLGLQQVLDHSLADETEAGACLVHTLVARTLRFYDPDPQRQNALEQAALGELRRAFEAAPDIRRHAALLPLLPHAQTLAKHSDDDISLDLAGRLGRYEFEAGHYHAALIWYEAEYEERRKQQGEEHPDTLTSMGNLAETLRCLGDLVRARALHEKGLNTSRRPRGEEHPSTLSSMNNLAATLRSQGDLVGARALQERGLEVCRRVLGEEHQYTLGSMNNLALTLMGQGDLTNARALHEKVLEVQRRVQGEEHPYTLTSMNNLASTLGKQGDLAGARAVLEKGLEVQRRVMGEEHPDTLGSMNNLALTLRGQGDLVGARALQEKLLEICRRVLGEDHPNTLASMNSLAVTLWNLNERESALLLMQAAYDGLTRRLGPEHPQTRVSRDLLAQMRAVLDEANP
jgi:hypothetical protein